MDSANGHTMPYIVGLIENSPAEKVLYQKESYYIVKVNGVSSMDKSLAAIVDMIRGQAGTPVKITLADNMEGKHAQEYTLTRAVIAAPAQAAPAAPPAPPGADPVAIFNSGQESEVKQMRRKGATIIKTFNSECGDYFFNFDAESGAYNVRFVVMEDKGGDNTTTASVRVFDNNDEKGAIVLGKPEYKEGSNYGVLQLSGSLAFKKESVATISVKLNDDAKKCKAVYIVVYK
jgi:hypothetical protein